MIIKPRKLPIKTKKLIALARRLPPQHPQYPAVERDMAINLAAHRGENSLNYYLSFLPEKEYLILHHIRLKGATYFFQMDTLLLTSAFILILETKTINGTLLFDEKFRQMIRYSSAGEEQAFKDPITQVNHQASQLADWLKKFKFPAVPIETLVVNANQQTILKSSPGSTNAPRKVVQSADLINRIHQLNNNRHIPHLTPKDLRKLSKLLLKYHIDENPDLLSNYKINKNELIQGVYCPSCKKVPMKRVHGSWLCLQCGTLSNTAHLAAFQDYGLLVNQTMTNLEVRKFLNIDSAYTVKRLLAKLELPFEGTNKARKYTLTDAFLEKELS